MDVWPAMLLMFSTMDSTADEALTISSIASLRLSSFSLHLASIFTADSFMPVMIAWDSSACFLLLSMIFSIISPAALIAAFWFVTLSARPDEPSAMFWALIATCALVSLMEFMTSESMDFASVNELTSALKSPT